MTYRTKLTSLVLAAALCCSAGASAQIIKNKSQKGSDKTEVSSPQAPYRRSGGRAGRIQLQNENRQMRAELDSLRRLLAEYDAQLSWEDSLATEYLDGQLLGEGLAPGDYTPAITDSLLSLWYRQRQKADTGEGLGFDLDSVVFSSNVPDSVYLKRLARMNSFITLPYNETVRNYIILYSEKMPTKMAGMLALSKYYFPIFEETLSRYGMPEELKYLAVIESALNPVAVSRAGAKGMWQFMHTTAKNYGLRIDSYVDERLDPVKSAEAAARYLRDAYRVFGDWNLAISSYNCGSGNVNKAIRQAGKSDFWSIYEYLPRETRGYVPAFVGAMYAFTYYKEHGIVPDEVEMPAHVDTFQIGKMLHFRQLDECAGIPTATLRLLNPQYMHDVIPGSGDCVLRLPFEYSGNFIDHEDSVYTYKASEIFTPATLENIKNGAAPQTDRIVYKVKKGDYLGKIASRYHVTVNQIKNWNNLRSNNLRIGQTLVIYRRGSAPAASAQSSSAKSTSASSQASSAKSTSAPAQTQEAQAAASPGYTVYTVKKGDTLTGIAAKYRGVSANDIMKFNNIGSNIKAGQKIKIPRK